MSLYLYCNVREPIIEGQIPLHKTGKTFFLNNRSWLQCNECGELAPIPLRLDILIKYVNQLWGDREGTVFETIDFTANVREKEVTLVIGAGGYFL